VTPGCPAGRQGPGFAHTWAKPESPRGLHQSAVLDQCAAAKRTAAQPRLRRDPHQRDHCHHRCTRNDRNSRTGRAPRRSRARTNSSATSSNSPSSLRNRTRHPTGPDTTPGSTRARQTQDGHAGRNSPILTNLAQATNRDTKMRKATTSVRTYSGCRFSFHLTSLTFLLSTLRGWCLTYLAPICLIDVALLRQGRLPPCCWLGRRVCQRDWTTRPQTLRWAVSANSTAQGGHPEVCP